MLSGEDHQRIAAWKSISVEAVQRWDVHPETKDRQRFILAERSRGRTLQSIAEELHRSRERIRMIELYARCDLQDEEDQLQLWALAQIDSATAQQRSIRHLALPRRLVSRIETALWKQEQPETIFFLCTLTTQDLLRMHGVGRKGVQLLIDTLARYGWRLKEGS